MNIDRAEQQALADLLDERLRRPPSRGADARLLAAVYIRTSMREASRACFSKPPGNSNRCVARGFGRQRHLRAVGGPSGFSRQSGGALAV